MNNKRRQLVIPSPEVQHLTTIFRRISIGDIRMPAFQRGFVWEDDQVLQLLESVYSGYPIGSLLFWRRDSSSGVDVTTIDSLTPVEDSTETIPFPGSELVYPTNYVLDGMQRLSTLFGVFYAPEINEKFDVYFNLREKSFDFATGLENVTTADVHLSDLFNPRKLLEAQSKMQNESDGDDLIEASVDLLSAFQEYMLPVVTISSNEIEEVVRIFERVNNTGTKLSRVHFIRALTWSSEFDLTKKLTSVQNEFIDSHFNFESETLLKILAIVCGLHPTQAEMTSMRTFTPERLNQAIVRSQETIGACIHFLHNECHILSSEFVPYEGQILVLAKFLSSSTNPKQELSDEIRRWFWTVSLSEALRGKADHYVTRALDNVVRLLDGDLTAMRQSLSLAPEVLAERRFIRGKSLSSGIAALFAARRTRSIHTNEVIAPAEYLLRFNPDQFEPIIPLEVIKSILRRNITSNKLLANVILISRSDRRVNKMSTLDHLQKMCLAYDDPINQSILVSQFINSEAAQALSQNSFDEFLYLRAGAMWEGARDLLIR